MRLSLIITTYNSPEFLRKVLSSVQVQVRLPDEVLVADDGSDERTALVVKEAVSMSQFPIFHVWQENRGFRAARIRNKAIAQSSGDYIVLLDGDCVVDRLFVGDHLQLAERGHFVVGRRMFVNSNSVDRFNAASANSYPILLGMALTKRLSNIHHLIRLPFLPPFRSKSNLKGIKSCNMGFSRKDVLAVNGFNEDFVGWGNEDTELAFRFFRYGLKNKVHPFMAVCFHLWHPTNKKTNIMNEELLQKTMGSNDYVCRNGIVKEN